MAKVVPDSASFLFFVFLKSAQMSNVSLIRVSRIEVILVNTTQFNGFQTKDEEYTVSQLLGKYRHVRTYFMFAISSSERAPFVENSLRSVLQKRNKARKPRVFL
jgi:hypothetical protein